MIRRLEDVEHGAVLEADVCVVGAGIAGIEVAVQLGRRGLRVALLESGRLEYHAPTQELARATFAGRALRTPETHGTLSDYLPPMYRGHPRLRQFGGTANLWTGKWRVFAPHDFRPRPWIAHSGWPISLDDLRPHYEAIERDYGFGSFATAADGAAMRAAAASLGRAGLDPHLFFWERVPTRPGDRFFRELRDATTIDVLLGANATALDLDDGLGRVRAVHVASLDGRRAVVHARHVVLATGGLEVARLLLASDRQQPGGIGNAHDLVGRFFMDHPKHTTGRLLPGRRFAAIAALVRTHPRPRFGISLALSEREQAAHALLNHAVYLRFPVPRFRGGPVAHYALKLGLEQAPNRDSRIMLARDRDALGMRRTLVDWRFTPLDHASLAALVPRLVHAFAAAGLGRLDFGAPPPSLDDLGDASHHMGTTRMARDAREGVVDVDCRVFGTNNLFVASSAVFPTGHSYSPTYTILAIARRLASHVAGLYAMRPARATARGSAPGQTARA